MKKIIVALKNRVELVPELIGIIYFVISITAIFQLTDRVDALEKEKEIIRGNNKQNISLLKDSLLFHILKTDQKQTDSVVRYFTNFVKSANKAQTDSVIHYINRIIKTKEF